MVFVIKLYLHFVIKTKLFTIDIFQLILNNLYWVVIIYTFVIIQQDVINAEMDMYLCFKLIHLIFIINSYVLNLIICKKLILQMKVILFKIVKIII